ncbi:MAG: exodeoxyribonuclease III [Vicinamibacterales bacterium]
MKIATWNVNGIRARQGQLLEWLATERPDIVCLQEIKASLDQLPFELRDLDGYHAGWHGDKGYSGVGLLVAKTLVAAPPVYTHPVFDFERRVISAELDFGRGPVLVSSFYVPNGGKDYDAKISFLTQMDVWAEEHQAAGRALLFCGDLNVALTERDVHPRERKPNQIGTRDDERALITRLLSRGLVDIGRTLEPGNDELFTWWAPWRNLKQRNIGWRIDYVIASSALASRASASVVQRDVGTSDHGPVVVTLSD